MTLEISLVGDIVVAREELAGFRPNQLDDFIFRPNVELAFFAFGIGIERCGKCALARGHFASKPFYGLTGAPGE